MIGVLKAWMEDYFADFGEDEEFLELLSQFIEVFASFLGEIDFLNMN